MRKRVSGTAVLLGAMVVMAGIATAGPPTVKTLPARHVTAHSARLRGTVRPHGQPMAYLFEYGLSPSYGLTTRGQPLPRLVGTVSLSATVRGLVPGTVYHFRLVTAHHPHVYLGPDMTFRTAGNPPAHPVTGSAVGVQSTAATVTGELNTNGQKTKWYFQYGLTRRYGSTSTAGATTPGTTPVFVARQLTGLKPGRLYHYQLDSITGTTVNAGPDATFFTLPSRLHRPHLSMHVRPQAAVAQPYTFTISGRVRPPRSMPARFVCAGAVVVRFLHFGRLARVLGAPVGPACRYVAHVTFRIPAGRVLRRPVPFTVQATYSGDRYLKPSVSGVQTVTIGP